MHSIVEGKIDNFADNRLLFERMENILMLRLANKPKDEIIRNQLAICKRQQGKLDEVRRLYSDLHTDFPQNPDYYFSTQALNGRLEGIMPKEIKALSLSPLVQWPDFLPPTTIQETLDYMCQHQKEFHLAKLMNKNGKARSDKSIRNNTDLNLKGHSLKGVVRERIRKNIPTLTRQLGLQAFEVSHIEVQLRAYHRGQYFRTHQDGGRGRLINFVHFFYPEPKRFTGGDLVIFDTDTKSSTFNHSFTRIIPKHNHIVFFPSNYYHAVLPVDPQDDDFLSGRFVINGHIRVAEI